MKNCLGYVVSAGLWIASLHLGAAHKAPADKIIANSVTFYYEDVSAALDFYTQILGFEQVADHDGVIMLRVTPTTYLILSNYDDGLHHPKDPKTSALSMVTRYPEVWYGFLVGKGVPIKHKLRIIEGRPITAFVAIDPGGYLLEFERFNQHQENKDLLPRLAAHEPTITRGDENRPEHLEVQANIQWLYYDDVPAAQKFYEEVLGLPLIVSQKFSYIYAVSDTGYIGLVDSSKGMHKQTPKKAVTIGFITRDLEECRSILSHDAFPKHSELTTINGLYQRFIGIDPVGHLLAFRTYLDHHKNPFLKKL